MFVLLFVLFVLSVMLALYLTYMKVVFYVSVDVFSTWFMSLDLSFYFDIFSSWFMSVILLISSIVMVYSYNYMAPYSMPFYFLWVTFLFVLSMLLVVLTSSIFYLMLGWDGLGLVSFFLIIYYQNSSSILSGIFTLLMNRIGDGFFLVSIALFMWCYGDMYVYSSSLPYDGMLCFLLCITFMTKSALYPFSSWLPMAMSAPTPISALVHSSTLVTAGLFLMIRYHYLFYSSVSLMKVLVVVGLFTSFYAGLNALFETDMKKMIALSTLSHLGFIAFSFSSGMLSLAFFHLLVHALFKSLLFMAMGDIIVSLSHSQDIRYLSAGSSFTSFSYFMMVVSLLNLLGMPNISGFFSKDLILELFSYSYSGYVCFFMLYMNVLFTYFYTYTLFIFSYSSCKLVSFQVFHFPFMFHSILLFVLSVISVLFGKLFLTLVFSNLVFVCVPSTVKSLPIILNAVLFMFLVLFFYIPNSKSSVLSYYFSSMSFLTPFLLSCMSFFYYKFSFFFVKSFELGLLNSVLHSISISGFSGLVLGSFSLYKYQIMLVMVMFSLIFIIL